MPNILINRLKDTLRIIHQGFYIYNSKKVTLSSSNEVKVYLPNDVHDLPIPQPISGKRTRFRVENTDTFTMARQGGHENTLALNFANAFHPGGGVRLGVRSQEEDLCRASTLLPALESKEAGVYYEYHRNNCDEMASESIMVHPHIEIFKDEDGNLLEEPVQVAVLTCAAPDMRGGRHGYSKTAYKDMFYRRIEGILKVAATLGYQHLVLGAFGCGVFGNDSRLTANLFKKAFDTVDPTHTLFKTVDFAVLSRTGYHYRMFKEVFSNYYNYTFFWNVNEENEVFSNWYECSFTIDGQIYFCVEQYMMAKKALYFKDTIRYTQIMNATSPKVCKELGRQVTPFDASAWSQVSETVVYEANYAKFTQNEELMEILLFTGDSYMAEASPSDLVWGIGLSREDAEVTDPKDWPGTNKMGKILMKIRKEKREGNLKCNL